MKKQTKIIIAIVLAIVVIIFAISVFYPPAFKGLTSGTIGKADKYHKAQMTEKDIQLRSEFTADTGQLRSMIQGLIYFSLFTDDLSNKIDSCVSAFQHHGICSQQNGCEKIRILQDYSDFIKNNNTTLSRTISMLTGFYLKDQSDQSADVEKNIRDFGNYVKDLNEKDSILEVALRNMDDFMITNRAIKDRKIELAQLKSIRDQLLIKGIQLSGMLQDKPLCSNLLSYALSSQEGQLGKIGIAQEQIGSSLKSTQSLSKNLMQEAVQSLNLVNSNLTVGSAQQLGNVLRSQQLESSNLKKNELGSKLQGVIIYDKASLNFIFSNISSLKGSLSAAQLNSIVLGSKDLGAVAYYSNQGLNLVASSYDLKNAYQSQLLGSALSSAQLNSFINAQGNIGSFSFGSNFIGMTQQLNNMGLGIIK